MPIRPLFPFLAVTALLAACETDTTAPVPQLLAVSANERVWREKQPANYQFVRQFRCYCLNVDPRLVTVRNGVITSVVNLRTNVAEPIQPEFAIDSAFAIIRREAVIMPDRLSVTYDDRLGFPRRVSFGQQEVDGGGVLTIDSLRTDP